MPIRSPKNPRPDSIARTIRIACLAALLSGCQSTMRYSSPVDARVLTAALERNYHTIDRALYAGQARVSFRFRDDSGRTQNLPNQSATIIFEHPDCFYFDIKNDTIGSIARIGANEERYWLWVALPDMRKLWWGTWDVLKAGRARGLVVPPDQLLDALMFGPPQRALSSGPRPLVITEAARTRLVYQRNDSRGWPYVAREIFLARRTNLPEEIRDYNAQGELVMQALLSDYQPVTGGGAGGPRTPRRYLMKWPGNDAELRITLGEVRYRNNDVPFCDFPERFSGDVEALDESRSSSSGRLN